MRLLTKRSLVAVLALTVTITAIAAVIWVAATTQGTRWLLTSASRLSGVSFSAQKIEGRIIDHLFLTDVRLDLAQQKLEIHTLELRWKPLLLLTGTVAVQDLNIAGVRIQDATPPDHKPPNLAWPRASETARLFDGKIARVQITNLSYRRLQEQPVEVTSIVGTVTWQDSTLTLSDLKASSPSANINGSVSTGFNTPSLTANLAVALAQPIAEMDRFSLQARKSLTSGPEPFVGNITIAGSSGARKLLELGGDVGMAGSAISLRQLHLTRPGQKGLITADGSLKFTAGASIMSLQVKAAGLDLTPELNVPTNLSGLLTFKGTLDSYQGNFSFSNQAHGWQAATVAADYHGTSAGMKLAPLSGSIIDGSLSGNLDLNWRDGFALQGSINGRNLNPARIDPSWKGVANFSTTGKLAKSGKTPLTGSVSGTLLESTLHGQALTGELQATFADNNLSLAQLALHGKGFDLHASGELNQRLALTARISDFSRLVPGSAGTLQADGWLRWRAGQLSGAATGTGSKLAYHGSRIAAANLTARLDQGPDYPMHVSASLRDVLYEGYTLNAVTVAADGTLARHTANATLRSGSSEAHLALTAGYNDSVWKGEITRLAGRDANGPWKMAAPSAFSVSSAKVTLSPLSLTAGNAEHLELAVDLALNPLTGQIRAQWTGLNLTRANPYLKEIQFSGRSHGNITLGFLSGERLALSGSAAGSGTFTSQGSSVTVQRSQITVAGSEQGLRIGMELGTTDGGRLQGTFSSTAPFRRALPERGELTVELSGIDLALLRPWLPPDTDLAGHISGQAKGNLLPGHRFELDGSASIAGATLHQQRPDGELKLTVKSAATSWGWRGETLSGTLSLATAEYGQARGNFQLPLPARFPVAINPKGPLRATLTGQVQEKGIITALFPGLVQESFGELNVDLDLGGTWAEPLFGGKLRLAKAGAYLPTAGIHLKDVQLAARLENNLVLIDSFKAVSGPGHIEGTARLTLAGWQVVNYQGTINGENFQTVYFPELRILSTPKLRFEGTPQKLTLRGDVSLPELNIVGTQSRKVIAASSDVIREGRVIPAAKTSPLALDVQVRVLLGEKVHVKVAGIDAQLGGAIDMSFTSLDRITSAGEIKVTKGRYRTYGVDLEIIRGRLFFAGGTIDRPSLDFLALRTIGNIRAGVTVAGTLQKPVTKLYSEPAMPDVDVLAYIVLGHPLGSSGQQANLLTQAAGALLTTGQAAVLQEQVRNYFGLSTLEIQGGVGGAKSSMGYTPLQVTPPGSLPEAQQTGITETVLTVGKYLTPQLYISYGKSLFTGNNLFRLRYDIFKNWQIETQTSSEESGADLYYKMEFK